MKTLNTLVTVSTLAFLLSACGSGSGEGSTSSTTNNTDSDTNTTTSNSDTGGDSNVNGDTDFSLICESPDGLVGCWITPCIETNSISQIYAQQMVSFQSDGTATISTQSHLGSASCESSNPIEVVGLYDRTFAEGDSVLTGSGTTATELNSTQAIPMSQTLTQRFSIFQIVADQLCVPDADYNWEPGNHPGFTFGPTNPAQRGTDIDFANCLTRYVP